MATAIAASHAEELLATAAHLASREDVTKAQRAADEVLELFASADGVPLLVAEAVYYAVSARAAQGHCEEASVLANTYLVVCRGCAPAGDSDGARARLLLAVAEASESSGCPEKLRAALSAAEEAQRLLSGLGDAKWEAAALLQVANLHLKRSQADSGDDDEDYPDMAADEAMAAAEAALPLLRSVGDGKAEAVALHTKALAAARADDLEVAIAAARHAAALFRELGLTRLAACELRCLSVWTLADDRPSDAMAFAQEALQLFRQVESQTGQASFLETFVNAAFASGDAAAALEATSAALASGEPSEVGCVLELHVAALLAMEDLDGALRAACNASAAYETNGDVLGAARACNLVAQLHLRAESFEQALQAADSACIHAGSVEMPNAAAAPAEERMLALQTIAAVHLAHERVGCASKVVEQVVQLAPQIAKSTQSALVAKRGLAASLLSAAGASCAQGTFDEAISSARQAQELLSELGDSKAEASCFHLVAQAHLAQGQHNEALVAAEGARAVVKQTGELAREVGFLIFMSQICTLMLIDGARSLNSRSKSFLEGRGRDKVLRVSKEAVSLARQVHDPLLLAFALTALARAHGTNKDFDAALECSAEALPLLRQEGDVRGEAVALLLSANIHAVAQRGELACMSVKEALKLFQSAGDLVGEVEAINLLTRLVTSGGGPAIPGTISGLGGIGDFADGGKAAAGKAAAGLGGAVDVLEGDGRSAVPGAHEAHEAASSSAVATRTGPSDIRTLPLAERIKFSVTNLVLEAIGRDEIEEDRTLMETGMTSIASIMLRDRLQDEFPDIEDMDLTFVFDYPTIREISEFILDALPDQT